MYHIVLENKNNYIIYDTVQDHKIYSAILHYLRESRNQKETRARFKSNPIMTGLIQSHLEGAQGLQNHIFSAVVVCEPENAKQFGGKGKGMLIFRDFLATVNR